MTDQAPHKRKNLLTGDWVLVSPHRLQRPWQGEASKAAATPAISYDPDCYLCPGNKRAGGQSNPAYSGVYVFDNDYPALLPEAGQPSDDPLLVAEPETGVCRVICYSPDHSRTMSQMSAEEITAVIEVWGEQYASLAANPDIAAVTIFENRGAMMGASNPHPHGQLWATSTTPPELARECDQQAAHFEQTGRYLLLDYLDREDKAGERIVCATEHFVALVPFWAAWPFETIVLPRRAVGNLAALSASEQKSLAMLLGDLTRAYDRLFETSFPYTMGWHQQPVRESAEGFLLHAHFYPPLLRSATVRKHMVGFEMLAMPQRDITPEAAAERLRAVST